MRSPNGRSRSAAVSLLAALGCICAALAAAAWGEDNLPSAATPAVPRLALEPVTLSAQDLEIREALAMLSRSRGLNIVCAGDVSGAISVDLHAVPFEEALHAVVAMAGFEVTRQGSLYFVRRPTGEDPAAALMRETRTFRLDYARTDQIQPVVERLLSPIGRVTGYPPLRTLIVEERPDQLANIDAIIRTLDAAPRQVLIEARILQARLAKDMRFGINWSLAFSKNNGIGDVNVEGFAGAAGSGEGMFVSWGQGDFAAALQTLEGVEELSTVAAPRVLAIDGSEAQIMIGDQLGFPVLTTVDNTIIQSVQFLDTGTQLRITPTITGDGYILMKIHPELSDGSIKEGLPSKSTTEVTTDVLIKDGHTLFIGGLIRDRTEKIRVGLPLLMHLPLLGPLFGRTVVSHEKNELITLITPRIVKPGEDVPHGSELIQP